MAAFPPHIPRICLLLIFSTVLASVDGSTIHRSDHELSRFVYSPSTQSFFVAGTNVLLELNQSTLRISDRVKTGPKPDSPACHASGCTDDQPKVLTDNVNKVLVLDSEGKSLITCGSLFQGSCTKYSVDNLDQSEFLAEPVAANDNSSSTFAFIGPQRYHSWGHGNVLYVGTTFTHVGDYRIDVPAISSRNLHDLQFAQYSFSKQSLLRIDVKYRDRFLVKYMYGFSTSTHVYFVTVQKKSHIAGHEEHGQITRLARACITDPNFDTYSEVTLECSDRSGKPANILTAATLLNGDKAYNFAFNHSSLVGAFGHEDDPSKSSVCTYTMDTIERLFDENIHNCFNGSMQHRNMEYISGPIQEGKCPTMGKVGNILNFCEVGLKISGKYPIKGQSIIDFQDGTTSITADAEHGVVFLGTQKGQLLGISLAEGRVFDTRDLGGQVRQLDIVDNSLMYLTPSVIGRMALADCGHYSDCEACASARNPYCRWCALASTCSLVSECPGAHDSTVECIQLLRVEPDILYPSPPFEDIYLFMSGVSQTRDAFLCKYSDEVTAPARRFSDGLVCPSPLAKLGSEIRDSSVNISIVYASAASSVRPLFTKSMSLLDCSPAADCNACLNVSNACHWCFESQTCTHKMDPTCAGSGQTQCPRIVPSLEPAKVPNDVPRTIDFVLTSVPSYITRSKLFCMVLIEGAKMKIPARLRGSKITCEKTRYKFQSDKAELNVTVQLFAGDNGFLDETSFILYKCEQIGLHRGAQDCSLCQSKRAEYGCRWCGDTCAYAEQCEERDSGSCPRPELFAVFPPRGPLEGGTTITLDGINLKEASGVAEASMQIKVAGRMCKMIPGSKSPSKISCVTGPASVEQNASIHLESRRGNSKTTLFFTYVDYFIYGLSPKRAPMSGGINVTIFGKNLDIGSKTTILLDNIPCQVDASNVRNGDEITCRLGSSNRPKSLTKLTVYKDNAIRTIPITFKITPDPTVRSIKPLRSFSSGGRLISIIGNHFSSLQTCELVVYLSQEHSVSSNCSIINDQLMECLSPRIQLPAESNSLDLEIGLRAANVSDLLLLKKSFPFLQTQLTYVPDPALFNLTDGYTVSEEDALVIEGNGIDLASEVGDVNVRIGQSWCNVTSITHTQLLCYPPAERPQGLNGQPPELIVSVGQWMEYNLGSVSFASDRDQEYSSEIIGALGAAAALVVFLAVIILIMLRHKSSEVEREYKRIQIQMDILEHNVRSECKQAFAELQTDMSDLTVDLESSGIPTFARKAFLMKVFFPGVDNHPVVSNELNGWANGHQQTAYPINQFETSLMDKSFLLEVIHAFETNPSFGVRDKINFASLLSVFLSTKMEYFSEILRTLLTALLQDKKHPEALLRRTETIAEKLLTNWLALCLYDYVKDELGPPLFFLCKAVKYQVEKGPVDQISQESKYSLSEEGLLRTGIDYSIINCLVLQRELEEAYEAKVLDCDSISQVKGKILDAVYKNTPFSMRPNIDEIDLEWQCGQDAHVILQDVDLTSENLTTSLRRVNTFKHYGIKQKALVSLVPKQLKLNSPSRSEVKLCHLQVPDASILNGSTGTTTSGSSSFRSNKTIPEVYLTRLLATKGTLKKYIDDLIHSLTEIKGRFPASVKWLFDLLDDNVSFAQPDSVLHTLKSNSLPLRMWLMLIKNPDMIFDMERTCSTDTNLNVIAQLLVSSCASTEVNFLSKEAPPQKLLFAKEIVEFQQKMKDFFNDVQRLPKISDFEFNCHMNQLSLKHKGLFNERAATQELLLYVSTHLGQPVDFNQDLDDTYCTIPVVGYQNF